VFVTESTLYAGDEGRSTSVGHNPRFLLPYRTSYRRVFLLKTGTNPTPDPIIIIITETMFMVLSSWQSHRESSPGSFDECRMAPSCRRPKTKPDDLGCECESACTGCQKLQPPSPFIIITQPKIRPTRRGPDPNRPTNGSKQGGYDLRGVCPGGFGRTPPETIGDSKTEFNRILCTSKSEAAVTSNKKTVLHVCSS